MIYDIFSRIETDKIKLDLIKETIELFIPELKKYTTSTTFSYNLSCSSDRFFIIIDANVNLICYFSNKNVAKIEKFTLSMSSCGELSIYIQSYGLFHIEANYSETLLHPDTLNTFIGPAAIVDLFNLICKENYILTNEEKIIKDIIE